MNTKVESRSSSQCDSQPISAGPLRRLAAIVYDTLLSAAVAAVAVIFMKVVMDFVLPSMSKRMLVVDEIGVIAYLYRIWAAIAVASFLAYSWTRKGQTLGMLPWRLRIQTMSGQLPSWRDSAMRILAASMLLGIPVITLEVSEVLGSVALKNVGLALLILPVANYLAAFFDPLRRSWHDRFLQTRIRFIPK